MKRILNLFTYLMFMSFYITLMIGMMMLADFMTEYYVKWSKTPVLHPKFWELLFWCGCMCVVFVVGNFLYPLWKKHFRFEIKEDKKRNFTSTGLFIDDFETNNK